VNQPTVAAEGLFKQVDSFVKVAVPAFSDESSVFFRMGNDLVH